MAAAACSIVATALFRRSAVVAERPVSAVVAARRERVRPRKRLAEPSVTVAVESLNAARVRQEKPAVVVALRTSAGRVHAYQSRVPYSEPIAVQSVMVAVTCSIAVPAWRRSRVVVQVSRTNVALARAVVSYSLVRSSMPIVDPLLTDAVDCSTAECVPLDKPAEVAVWQASAGLQVRPLPRFTLRTRRDPNSGCALLHFRVLMNGQSICRPSTKYAQRSLECAYASRS